MITCVISTILVRWWLKYSIYTMKLVRKGVDIEKHMQMDLMETISVSDAMITDMITVLQSDTVRKTGLMIKATNHRGFPVLDENRKLVGMVTRKDINKALSERAGESEIKNPPGTSNKKPGTIFPG